MASRVHHAGRSRGTEIRPPGRDAWMRPDLCLEALRLARMLAASHLLPSVRGDLLARAGRRAEAATAFLDAAALTRNESERRLLRRRAAELG